MKEVFLPGTSSSSSSSSSSGESADGDGAKLSMEVKGDYDDLNPRVYGLAEAKDGLIKVPTAFIDDDEDDVDDYDDDQSSDLVGHPKEIIAVPRALDFSSESLEKMVLKEKEDAIKGNGNDNGSGPTKYRILVLPLGGSTVVPITTITTAENGVLKKKHAKTSVSKTSVVTEQQPSASVDNANASNNNGGRDCSINLTIPSNNGENIGEKDENEDEDEDKANSGDRLCEKLCRCCQLYLQMAFGGTTLILFAGLCATLVEGYDNAAFPSLLFGVLVFLVLFALCCCQCCDLVLTALIEKALVAADAAHRRKYGKTVAERHRIRRQQLQRIQVV